MANPYEIQIPGTISRDAFDVCSVAGVNLMSKNRIRFKQMADTLEGNIRLLNEANATEKWASRAILGLSMIKASCEAFVDMAGTLGEVAGLKGVKQASSWLGASAKASDYLIAKTTGQKADGFGTAKAFADAALGSNRVSKNMSEPIKDVIELKSIQIDMIKNTVQGDIQGLKRDVFLSYIPKIAQMSLNAIQREVAGKLLSAGTSIAKSGASYSDALDKAFDDKLSADESLAERAKLSQQMQVGLKTVISQIKVIDSILADCRMGRGLA